MSASNASQFSPQLFARAEFAFLREATRRDINKVEWDFLNFILDRSWRIGRVTAYFNKQKSLLELVPWESVITRTLAALLAKKLVLTDGTDTFYINPDFAAWAVKIRAKKGKRRLRNAQMAVDSQDLMRYGELPEEKELNRDNFLEKIAVSIDKNLRVETGAPAASERPSDGEGPSSDPTGLSLKRTVPRGGPLETPPPDDTHLTSPRAHGRPWVEIVEDHVAGKITYEELIRLGELMKLPKRTVQGSLAAKLIPAQPIKNISRAPEKSEGARQWLLSIDKAGRLKDRLVAEQWRILCEEDPDYILGPLKRRLASWRPPDGMPLANPLGLLAKIARDENKCKPLSGLTRSAALRAGEPANLTKYQLPPA